MNKPITGEKYIYLAMAYRLCKESPYKSVRVGDVSGIKGTQNFERCFSLLRCFSQLDELMPYRYLLRETKTDARFVTHSRYFVVRDEPECNRPHIEEITESGVNFSSRWQNKIEKISVTKEDAENKTLD